MSKTPLRAVRVDPELWESARAVAASNGDNLSAVIRDALRRYVDEDDRNCHCESLPNLGEMG